MSDSLFKEENNQEFSKLRKRKKKKASKPKFIEYNQHQRMLLPASIEEMIPEKHIVRTVNKVIDTMNIEALIKTYKGGGRSSYDPVMMLKILVYAYVMKIYTSRRIAKALREDINFMWISGMQQPNFRTINNFRSGRLRKVIDEIFSSMILFLTENSYIKLENYFIDGTKIEANANRYTYVWSKNTDRYTVSTKQKIKELLKQIDKINREENNDYGDKDLEELGEDAEGITSEKIEEQVKKLNKIISQIGDESVDKKKKIKKAVKELDKKYLPKLRKYEQQDSILNGRSSYSKTDKDSSFLMSKTDQLLPSYNVIIGTEEQIIINYSVHQGASETDKFVPHIEKLKKITKAQKPKRITGDGTYGSEENYNYLEQRGIESYLKYPGFYQEITGKAKKNQFNRINFTYNEQEDKIYCPEGKQMSMVELEKRKTDNGYFQEIRKYRGECKGCKYFGICSKSPGGRTIQINKKLERYKQITKQNLISDKGIELRKKRSVDVETVFGDIKQNQGFRRFNLRGIEKVKTEFGLIAIAHNMKKTNAMIN
jgi:transposase